MATTSQPVEAAATTKQLKSRRTAMLVIHGIGEQNPYETLDSFARGVFSYFRDRCEMNVRLQPRKTAHSNWTEASMRIEVNPNDPYPCESYVDLYEYYWAPQTEDKISLRQTLSWLFRTDLSPLKNLAANLQEFLGSTYGKGIYTCAWIFWREIRRLLFLYLPLLAGLVWLSAWLVHPPSFSQAWKAAQPLFGPQRWAFAAALLFYALAAVMIISLLHFAKELVRNRLRTIMKRADRIWLALAALAAVVFFVIGFAIVEIAQLSLAQFWSDLLASGALSLLVAAGIAAVVRYFLVAYVGDVAVYVNADAKSKSFAARNAILDGSSASLVSLLISDKYDRVILAGHSLGSVIAYDTVNELLTRVTAFPGPGKDHPDPPLTEDQLRKLKGLVTFGSPLDKINYFFRQNVKQAQAIRAQILSMLHSFRKVPSQRDYGEFRFSYRLPQWDLRWLNAWSPFDPVSGRLHFYIVDRQEWFWYWVPVLAHLSYWSDPRFYRFLCDNLVLA